MQQHLSLQGSSLPCFAYMFTPAKSYHSAYFPPCESHVIFTSEHRHLVSNIYLQLVIDIWHAYSHVYRSVWLLRRAVMHFPRMSRELLMFPASFSLSPNVLVLLHLSEPARSHRENLRNANQFITAISCVSAPFMALQLSETWKFGPVSPEQQGSESAHQVFLRSFICKMLQIKMF